MSKPVAIKLEADKSYYHCTCGVLGVLGLEF